jgi:hypothetical protein
VALGEGIDDAVWSDLAIEYNIRLAANKLKKQTLQKMYAKNDMKGAVDFVTSAPYTLAFDATLEYRYATKPTDVFDLPQGSGINYISYYRPGLPQNCPPQVAKVQFYSTTWRELPMLYADPVQAPGERRPRYIVENDRVFIFGVNPLVTQVQMGLYLALDPNGIDDTEDLKMSPEALFDLRRMMLTVANWTLLSPTERLQNDGRDRAVGELRPTPPPQILSVNDPVLTTPND